MTWRWPWVSRALYDRAVFERDHAWTLATLESERLDGYAKRHAEELAAARQEGRDAFDRLYTPLLAQYHALKLAGAAPPPEPMPAPVRDPVASAIAYRLRGVPRREELRKILESYAARAKVNGVDPGDIAETIRVGVPGNWEEDGVPA